MNRSRILIASVTMLLVLQGCAGGGYMHSPAELTRPANAPYTLDTGDKVRVTVFGQAEFNNTYSIDASGAVALPLIGAVSARGLTNRQLEGAIAARLAQKFVKNPNVTVEVDTHRPFFILGEVTSSGQYSYVNGMTAQTAVAIAGGFSPRAVQDRVEITRTISGKPVVMVVPVSTIVSPGDTLRVLERYI